DHTVTVRVTENSGLSGSGTFLVIDPPPVVTAGPSPSGNEGSSITLSGVRFSYPGFAVKGVKLTFTATIDWGDGTKTTGKVTTQAGAPGTPITGTVSGSHTYKTFGVFPVTVTVTNTAGRSGQAVIDATVNNLAPVVKAIHGGTYTSGTAFTVQTEFRDAG